jgi:hypothetical protein
MPGLHDGILNLGPQVLDRGSVPGPPPRPWDRETAYPLAVDVDGRLVWFAVLDMYPDTAPGWWCLATTWSRDGECWNHAHGESDNTTSPAPFERPLQSENGVHRWCDWHSNGSAGHWGDEDEDPWRHTFFGIAPAGTARLMVTDETGRERDLHVTPWNGAYVAVVSGPRSTLTGYDERGDVLGSFMPMDGLTEGDRRQ